MSQGSELHLQDIDEACEQLFASAGRRLRSS